MKVAELEGAELDYWVARAEGAEIPAAFNYPLLCHFKDCFTRFPDMEDIVDYYSPSTNWSHGGPIIERELISTEGTFNGWGTVFWIAKVTPSGKPRQGCTPLIAAMRAFVASKFGDEVADDTK